MKEITRLSSIFALCVIIFSILISLQCQHQPKVKLLNEKLFVQVYCDVVVYADLIEAKHRGAFVDSVLNHYGVTQDQLLKTVAFYSKDETRWEKVFTKIIAELERREQVLKASVDSSQTQNRQDSSRAGVK